MARGRGDLTACFAFLWVPACAGKTVLPAGRIRGGSRTAPTGWTKGEGTVVVGGVGGMNPLRRCAPRPPFASLRCAKRGGVVVSRAIWDPTSWLGGVLRGLRE